MSAALLTLTIVHVALSLVGIVSGFVTYAGMLSGRRSEGWTVTFLTTTIGTSATGFLFPFQQILPSHVLGLISLVVLGVAVAVHYGYLARGRRGPVAYAVSAMVAQYLNVFVLVVQLFLKVPALRELAPTQTELPFALTQAVVLAAFVAMTILVVKRSPVGTDTGATVTVS